MEKTLKENRRFDTRTESKVGKKTKSRKDFEKTRRWKVGKKKQSPEKTWDAGKASRNSKDGQASTPAKVSRKKSKSKSSRRLGGLPNKVHQRTSSIMETL